MINQVRTIKLEVQKVENYIATETMENILSQ